MQKRQEHYAVIASRISRSSVGLSIPKLAARARVHRKNTQPVVSIVSPGKCRVFCFSNDVFDGLDNMVARCLWREHRVVTCNGCTRTYCQYHLLRKLSRCFQLTVPTSSTMERHLRMLVALVAKVIKKIL